MKTVFAFAKEKAASGATPARLDFQFMTPKNVAASPVFCNAVVVKSPKGMTADAGHRSPI